MLLIIPFGIMVFSSVSPASMLEQVVYNVVGQVSNAVGARLGDEVYYGTKKKVHHRKVRKKRRAKKKKKHIPSAPVMTSEKKIQKSLTSLGFYNGKIDGEVNSFETRTAIKNMNIGYGISNDASLRQTVRDTLIYMGTLFQFDRYLISSSNTKKSKAKKLQVALKIHGYYHGGIDGLLGKGSRSAVKEYQMNLGTEATGSLDFEAEYQLISSAKEKNDNNLNENINSLKSFRVVAPVQQQRYQQPVQQQSVQAVHQRVQQQRYQQQSPQIAQPAQQQNNAQRNIQYIQSSQSVQQQNNPQQTTQNINNSAKAIQKLEASQEAVSFKSTVKIEPSAYTPEALPDASSIEMYTDKK